MLFLSFLKDNYYSQNEETTCSQCDMKEGDMKKKNKAVPLQKGTSCVTLAGKEG